MEVTIEQLITKAIDHNLIDERDRIYSRNQILGLVGLDGAKAVDAPTTDQSIPQLLNQLIDDAIGREVISSALDEREKLDANIMNVFLDKPSEINRKFQELYKEDAVKATDFFYELSQTTNYIQTERIAKNIEYQTDTPYGKIDITINLSKPEKDPLQIKRELEVKQNLDYPKCMLCVENEGYVGRTGHPARSNHRIIDLDLEGEDWYFQYSPYVYYNEHSIVLNKEHRPMVITKDSFKRLFSFVEKFPHYFIGSNADLPIVGGSILSHDHYQAGRYTFGMTEAKNKFTFELDDFPAIEASVLDWPMSVIRLRANNTSELVEAGAKVLSVWQSYSDADAQIISHTDDTPHNTVTPIARYRNDRYELDLVLRNNRTTEEYPDGIFHPHKDVQHIKKENIGLIEVMGLAVLPPRLKPELNQMKKYLLGESDQVEAYHKEWADEIKAESMDLSKETVDKIVEDELAKKFVRVLEDAGVYKTDEDAQTAFKRFINQLNA